MVAEMLAARGIIVSHETMRQWARKFGQAFANQIRHRLLRTGDKWHLNEVVIVVAGVRHWLRRAGLTRLASSSVFWSKAGATSRPPSTCCASC